MVIRNSRLPLKRFTFLFVFVAFAIPVLDSCVSLRKYNKLETDFTKSKADCNDLIARISILQNDTTEYGVKYRTLKNDINYLQRTTQSEKDKMTGEIEIQRKQLEKKKADLDKLEQTLNKTLEDQNRIKVLTDTLEHHIIDSLKFEINTKEIIESRRKNDIELLINANDWFIKSSPFLSPEATDFLDKIASMVQLDSTLEFDLERSGNLPLKTGKNTEEKQDKNMQNKQLILLNYLMDTDRLLAGRLRILNNYRRNSGAKETYSIIIRITDHIPSR